jgi:hypothetical protein
VATLRLESLMRFSRSTFTEATLEGWVAAKAAKVRVAAKRRVAFGDDKNSCRTEMKISVHNLVNHGKLLTSDCPHELEGRNVLQFADDPGGFKVDHIALVFQPTVEKIERLLLNTRKATSAPPN